MKKNLKKSNSDHSFREGFKESRTLSLLPSFVMQPKLWRSKTILGAAIITSFSLFSSPSYADDNSEIDQIGAKELQSTLNELYKVFAEQQEERIMLEQQAANALNYMTAAVDYAENIENHQEELQAALDDINGNTAKLTALVQELTEINSRLQQENEHHTEQDLANAQRIRENEQSNADLQALLEKQSAFIATALDYENLISEYQLHMIKQQELLSQEENRGRALRSQYEALASEIEELHSQIKNDKGGMASLLQQKQYELLATNEEIQSLLATNTQLNQILAADAAQQSLNDEQRATFAEREKALADQYEALTREIEQRHSQAEKDKEEMTSLYQQKDQELISSQELIQDLTKTNDRLKEALAEAAAHQHSLKDEYQSEFAEQEKALRAKQEALVKEIERLQLQFEKDKDGLASVSQQKEYELIAANEEIQNLLEANIRLTEAFAALKSQYSLANEHIETIEKNTSLRESELNAQYDALAKEIEQLRSQTEKDKEDMAALYQQQNQALISSQEWSAISGKPMTS